ncbi:MAG: DUF4595 domain-containing protein [Paramuribaculum sp.]|nr:DUF4595 domain-containing protein [Paramuribaculum sp.]
MNKFLKFPCIAFAALAMTFASCSSDDNNGDEPEINPTEVAFVKNVFPLGLPESLDGARFTVNDKHQLTKITIPEDPDKENGPIEAEIIFEYGEFSRAAKFNVHMYIKKDGEIYTDYYIQLNEKGFATYVEESEDGDLYYKYYFTYNNDDQLASVKGIEIENGREDGTTEHKLTYSNGDITRIQEYYDGELSDDVKYVYTNSAQKQPVANKGCIMLFQEEDCFDIDFDEFKWAFYSGVLGKATKNLPMGFVEDSESGEFKWELNSNQLPVKFWCDSEDNESPDVVIRWK